MAWYNVTLWRDHLTLLPWKHNSDYPVYCLWHAYSCQRHETVKCCHENARVGSHCTVVDKQNIL